MNLGWFLQWLLTTTLKAKIEQLIAAGQASLPVTVFFQSGTVKGRIIIDAI